MGEKVGQIAKVPEAKQSNSNSRVRRTKHLQSMDTPVDRILFLQRTAGNQAVSKLMRSGALQAKLRIGQPGDVYEQEADRVADAVMRMPEPVMQRQVEPEEEKEETLQSKPLANQITPLIQMQRQEEPEEEEEMLQAKPDAEDITQLVQRQIEPEEEEEELQAKATSGHLSEVNSNLEYDIQSLKGGGQPLSENDRAFFEPRFGRDFSQVRVHTDANAASTAKAVNARAFTLGQDVVFGAEEYSSGSASGRKLIAHELTHVIQQNVSDNIKLKRAMSPLTVSKNEVVSRTTPIGIPKVQRLEIYGIKIKFQNMQDLLLRIIRIFTKIHYEYHGRRYHAWSISKVTTELTRLKKLKKWVNVAYRMADIMARNKKLPRKIRRQARINAKQMKKYLDLINKMIGRTQHRLRELRAGWVYVGRKFRVNPSISAYLIVAMGRIRSKSGVDITRGSSSYRGLNAPTTKGRIYASWHKTGRAIDLNQRERYVVVREGKKFRLYLRANIGVVGDIMGSRLLRRRIYLNPYGRRLRAMSLIDVTKIFLSLGFKRVPHKGTVAEWWHYEMVPSITWWQAMRQMYSYSTLRRVFRRHVNSGAVSRNYLIRKGKVPPAVLR